MAGGGRAHVPMVTVIGRSIRLHGRRRWCQHTPLTERMYLKALERPGASADEDAVVFDGDADLHARLRVCENVCMRECVCVCV